MNSSKEPTKKYIAKMMKPNQMNVWFVFITIVFVLFI